jgi:hypothetical protein
MLFIQLPCADHAAVNAGNSHRRAADGEKCAYQLLIDGSGDYFRHCINHRFIRYAQSIDKFALNAPFFQKFCYLLAAAMHHRQITLPGSPSQLRGNVVSLGRFVQQRAA